MSKAAANGGQPKGGDDGAYFIEKVTIEDDESNLEYGNVDILDSDNDDGGAEESLEAALKAINDKNAAAHKAHLNATQPTATLSKRPEVVDDFIRNYLVKMDMKKTLDAFQTEWYDLKQRGLVRDGDGTVPDVYQHNRALEEDLSQRAQEVDKHRDVAEKYRATWDKLRKERDYHRLHHKRVLEEKKRLVTDMKRLKDSYDTTPAVMEQLQRKYDAAIREKSLVQLECDKLRARVNSLQMQLNALRGGDGTLGSPSAPLPAIPARARTVDSNGESLTGTGGRAPRIGPGGGAGAGGKHATTKTKAAVYAEASMREPRRKTLVPAVTTENPYIRGEFEPARAKGMTLAAAVKGHDMTIAQIAVHPRKSVIATVSDDTTWKVWSIPGGELICAGEGHSGWVSGVAFHPQGSHLATSSGDGTVKMWDFLRGQCSMTYLDHSAEVWAVDFHCSGAYLVSCSQDQTARMWDVNRPRSIVTFRNHVNAVNGVMFQPYSNTVGTASGDHTVSLWDPNSGLCTQTFFGHLNAVNRLSFNWQGNMIASSDLEGIVKLWDVRSSNELATIATGTDGHPALDLAFDRSGKVLAIASEDATCKLASLTDFTIQSELRHDDAVHTVSFDSTGGYMITAGADCKFRVWQ